MDLVLLLLCFFELVFIEEVEVGFSVSCWVDFDGVLFSVDVYLDDVVWIIVFLFVYYLIDIDFDF